MIHACAFCGKVIDLKGGYVRFLPGGGIKKDSWWCTPCYLQVNGRKAA